MRLSLRRTVVALLVIGVVLLSIWFNGGRSSYDEISLAAGQVGIDFESKMVNVGSIKLHVVFAGPTDGEPIILLHGFPEYWFVWRHHMAILAQAGYRIAAPDLRGYNRSDKPSESGDYSTRKYANDIVGLMNHAGWDQANIVGHDIGAIVTWRLIFEEPDRVKSAVVFSVPHPLAVGVEHESGNTWYRTLFRMPLLPELLSRSFGLSMTAENLRETSRSGTFTDEEIKAYKAAWDREHAFTTMIGYYRANHESIYPMPPDGRPTMPVKYVYGMQDRVISVSKAKDTINYLGKDNVVLYPQLSHWLISEDSSSTANDIIDFVSGTHELKRNPQLHR